MKLLSPRDFIVRKVKLWCFWRDEVDWVWDRGPVHGQDIVVVGKLSACVVLIGFKEEVLHN